MLSEHLRHRVWGYLKGARSPARHPFELGSRLAALGVAAYVLAYPFTVVTYPPLVDLPFHAATTSIVRHYADPSFHFQEQFQFAFLKVPYWTQYLLGAGLATVLPLRLAVKLAAVCCLAALPLGLALLCRGLRKSPYLGLFALPLVWNKLTHWGFINSVAALGLSAAALGLGFLVLDAPSRARKVALSLLLGLVLVTHVFRYPFALMAVLGAALVLRRGGGRFKDVLVPALPSLVLFALWAAVRDPLAVSAEGGFTTVYFERFSEVPSLLFDSFVDPEENRRAARSFAALGLVAVGAGCLARWRPGPRLDGEQTRLGPSAVVAALCALYLLLFLTLPMAIGVWWYVYPREIVSALFMALALLPDLPRQPSWRAALLALPAFGSVAQAAFVADNYRVFEEQSADFRRILAFIPKAPRLGYLVLDFGGSTLKVSPFLHLPAWVQAEKGGWLSFHFASWNQSPVKYRTDSLDVPPPTPLRFEWHPGSFELETRGKFFDWFLVRSPTSPDRRFSVDPSLRRVAHEGSWWLYRRQPGQ